MLVGFSSTCPLLQLDLFLIFGLWDQIAEFDSGELLRGTVGKEG